MKKTALILVFTLILTFALSTFAQVFAADGVTTQYDAEAETEEAETEDSVKGTKAISAAIVVAVVAAAGAIGMAVAIAKCASGMARQPEAAGKINSAMMLGLVFIETAIIYALIVAILIIFVL